MITRPVLGPHGVALLEHVLAVLAPHRAGSATKLKAFAAPTAPADEDRGILTRILAGLLS